MLCLPIFLWRCFTINNELHINEEITAREVRLIDADGTQLGVFPTHEALLKAEDSALDLVMIVPNAVPPVCKLMDYDKHRFEQSKREREMRKNQKVIVVKEVQLSATIEENDINEVLDKRAESMKKTREEYLKIATPEIMDGIKNSIIVDKLFNMLKERNTIVEK